MKQISDFLFSRKAAIVLMLVFAVAIAVATFIENDFGTETAKKLVYVAPWFEVLLGLIVVNLIGNVFKEQLFRQRKMTIALFHLAFVLILAGGAITRYLGYEGTMHIREGESTNIIMLNKTYLTVEANYKGLTNSVSEKMRLTSLGSNSYTANLSIGGREVHVETELYLSNAVDQLVDAPGGQPLISLFVMDRRKGGHEYDLSTGERFELDGQTYSFDESSPGTVTFRFDGEKAQFISKEVVQLSNMMTKDTSLLMPGRYYDLKDKILYRMNGQLFVVKSVLKSAQRSIVHSSDGDTGARGLVVVASTDNATERVSLLNKNGMPLPTSVQLDDIEVTLSFGAIEKKLPFALELKDFILERYPGSNSPSSFASEVVVHDALHQNTFPYRIYMNHILNYKGFRFFQSSYDQDQRGTVLSVSHDFWGTFISYLGYLFMTLGMILTLLNKQSRFRFLIRRSREIHRLKQSTLPLVLLAVWGCCSIFSPASLAADSLSKSDHLASFNELLVQAQNGRIEPMQTMASEIMRKVHHREGYNGMSPTEVVLGMLNNPMQWKNEPLIRIENSVLAKDLGLNSNYIAFNQLFDHGNYRLKQLVDEVFHKTQSERNKYDKEIINLDERVNICYQIYGGSFLKIFPIPNDDNHTWTSASSFPKKSSLQGELSPIELYNKYVAASVEAQNTGRWQQADVCLSQIKQFQRTYGGLVVPSPFKVKMELLYGQWNIFGLLSHIYETLGLVLLIISLIMVFRVQFSALIFIKSGFFLSLIAFGFYTFGIAVRWYISGHAPWSNGYETMVFVGWATALAGFVFYRQSFITLAVTNLLAGIILMVAGFSWMNPEITPLVPVLKSFWLIIHVAVITSSYGFLAIGALLGFLNLRLIIFKNKKNATRLSLHISEISIITEIALIIGLLLLTIGSFLGAVWANESWGRYWGWDPKETWALITILVYAVVIHLNRISVFKSEVLFNGLALVSLSSVLMTFFGVNYYLSGMHSYAQGDGPPLPNAVYYCSILVLMLVAYAFYKEQKIKKKVST